MEQWAEIRRMYFVELLAMKEIQRRRRSIAPALLLQFDLFEPRVAISVGHGQLRRGWLVTAELGYSRALAAALVF